MCGELIVKVSRDEYGSQRGASVRKGVRRVNEQGLQDGVLCQCALGFVVWCVKSQGGLLENTEVKQSYL